MANRFCAERIAELEALIAMAYRYRVNLGLGVLRGKGLSAKPIDIYDRLIVSRVN